VQDVVPKLPPPVLHGALRLLARKRLTDWAFRHYLRIAPPEFVQAAPAQRPELALAA
jgi:hypothetical protein